MSGTPKDKTNLYDILGVPPTATREEIESAYRRLARRWHPDVSTEDDAPAENFKAVAKAYQILSDPEERRRYDRQRRHGLMPGDEPFRRGDHFGPIGEGAAARFFDEMDRLFEASFLGARRQPPDEVSSSDDDLDVEAELLLTSEEAAWGGWIEFALAFPETCPICDGEGQLGVRICWGCSGRGVVRGPSRLVQFELAPGLPDGTVLCLRGRGRPAAPPGASGDLYLRLRIR